MCSHTFNHWRFWCNKISDTLQLISPGNTGVVCPKHSSPEAESSCRLAEPPCFYRLVVAKTLIDREDLFFLCSWCGGWGVREIKSLLPPHVLWSVCFLQVKWNSDVLFVIMCSRFLSQCFLFKIGTHFLWMFFILYNLLSCKLHLQTLGLHSIVVRQRQEGNSTFQRDGFFLFCWKPIWGWFFLNIKFLQELHFVHKCFVGPHRPPVYWLQVEHVSFPPPPWLCVYGWPVVYGKVAGWSGWKTRKLFL